MTINKSTLRVSVKVILFFTLFISCKKVNQEPDYSYFVSKEIAVTYSKTYINTMINSVSGAIPEVNNLKPLITSDVDIYRIVYKTTVNGQKIEASGLICVPKNPGNYPVLSFQNGTNTINSYAPSEFAINYPYQMIEIVASMGYVVVIADYPGFGESVQIPHPYLIKEPTVQSLVDMLYTVKEIAGTELPGITLKNEFYLLGYSQGGWATLALHKALEIDYSNDFTLKGSACGAGPYNITLLLQNMINVPSYPMPVYIGYIVNAYTCYNQLTTSIPGLLATDFISGFTTSPKYASVRDALNSNSIAAWHSYKALLLIHGANDTQVNPISTENMYSAMIQAGTSADMCKKVIVPGVDHSDGVAPCMIQGILFLMNLNSGN